MRSLERISGSSLVHLPMQSKTNVGSRYSEPFPVKFYLRECRFLSPSSSLFNVWPPLLWFFFLISDQNLYICNTSVISHPFTLRMWEESGSLYCLTTYPQNYNGVVFLLSSKAIRQPHFSFVSRADKPYPFNLSSYIICFYLCWKPSRISTSFLSPGTPNWTPYSRCGSWTRGRITSHYLLVTLCAWVPDSVLLAFIPLKAHCWQRCTSTHDPFLQRCFLAE